MSQHFGQGTVRVCLATTRLLSTAIFALIFTSSFAQAQTLPSGWTGADVGGSTPAGVATYSSGTFTVEGGGRRVFEAADQFYFVYRQMTGDGTLVARVGSVENVNAYVKAGVMMRESLATGSRHGFTSVSPGQGIQFNRRLTTDGTSTITNATGAAPVWLRLVRSGSTFTASYSPDGTVWTAVGSDTISMASTIYVGLAVSSYNTSTLATATFSSVSVTAASGSTSALPSGWSASDIGSPAAAGSTAYASGTYTVAGGGIDIWGSSDQFRYVYRQMSGDVDVVARVSSLQGPHEWSKAGIMIRPSLNADAANVMAMVALSRGIAMQTRPSAGLTTTQSGRVTGTAPVWVKIERRGSAVTTFRSGDGSNWTMMGSATLTLGSSFYAGLAVTAHASAGTATAQFTNVSATAAAGTPTNTPPTVSLTSPAAGATFTAPATVSLAANAADTDNGVAMVEFYANGTLLGSDSSSPYAFSWTNVTGGSYSLTAVARDNAGATTTSTARSITVSGSTTNAPPTVSLTAPANGASYVAPASVTISANAADTDGSIARVDFYAGSLLVASDTTSPYSVTWSNAGAGSYSLTAIARDNAGATATSAGRSITIAAAPSLTTARFTPSPDHSIVTRYVLDVFTAGANPATATPMATRDLGRPAVVNGECSADVATTIAALPGGSYFATVVAVSSGGTSTRATSSVFAR